MGETIHIQTLTHANRSLEHFHDFVTCRKVHRLYHFIAEEMTLRHVITQSSRLNDSAITILFLSLYIVITESLLRQT